MQGGQCRVGVRSELFLKHRELLSRQCLPRSVGWLPQVLGVLVATIRCHSPELYRWLSHQNVKSEQRSLFFDVGRSSINDRHCTVHCCWQHHHTGRHCGHMPSWQRCFKQVSLPSTDWPTLLPHQPQKHAGLKKSVVVTLITARVSLSQCQGLLGRLL